MRFPSFIRRKPPSSVVENVTIDFYKDSLPGMVTVEIKVVAVVSPHILKGNLNEVAYGQKGTLEQFLKLALPHVTTVNAVKKIVDYANKVIQGNRPDGSAGAGRNNR